MNRNILTAGLLALAASSHVSALTLSFSDRGTWTSQVTSLTNFNGGAQAAGTDTNWGFGGLFSTNLNIDGYTINTGTPTNVTTANAGPLSTYYNWGSGAIVKTNDKINANAVFARISFPNPVSAFGFNFGIGGCPTYFNGCFPGAAGSITIAPNGLTPVNVTTVQGSTLAFWGVISDSQTFSFADIYINDINRYLVLDDIAQGSFSAPAPNEIAEPGTLIQLAMGGILLVMARRKFGAAQSETI